MAVSKQTIEDIRSHNDVVEVIGSYLQLKRGGGAYKGLCPFHKEKTPSFSVNPQRQIYHCFGCGAGGDVFKFIMEHEGVDFITAAKLLAHRAGLRVEFDETDRGDGPKKDVLFAIHTELARDLRTQLLESSEAESARAYLEERNLDGDIADAFQLGYAPQKGDRLLAWGKKKGYAPQELEAAGVVAKDDRGGYYARFRHRLMFPVHDELSRVIGFSGRILEKRENTGKYINSPETALFHKGRILYALDKARKPILESRCAIICEGQIDVIRCHEAGLTTAIAPQGTALTEDHGRVIKRYADEVVLVFDADAAGDKAAIRSAEICLGVGLTVRIAQLPPGEDPDSIIRQQGVDRFREIVDAAQSVVAFELDVLEKSEDLSSEVGVMRAAQTVLQSINHSSSAVQRDQLIKQAAARLDLSPEALTQDLRKLSQRARPGTGEEKKTRPKPRNYPPNEVQLAGQLANHPNVAPLIRDYLPLDALSDDIIRDLVSHMLEHAQDPDWDLMTAIPRENEDMTRLAARIQMDSDMEIGEDFTPERIVQDLIVAIRREAMKKEWAELDKKRNDAQGKDHEILDAECKQLKEWIYKLRQGWDTAHHILEIH